MTEKQQYIAMLERAEIPYEIYNHDLGIAVTVMRGYSFFYTSHMFDKDGVLVDVGAYE